MHAWPIEGGNDPAVLMTAREEVFGSNETVGCVASGRVAIRKSED